MATQIPHEVWIVIPRNNGPPRFDYPPTRAARLGELAYGLGIETHQFDGFDIKAYSGVQVTFQATIQNARLPMQIDVGFGDVVNPNPTIIDYPALLDFEPARLAVNPAETVIDEKFEAMVKLGQFNSRMKDFYDIQILSRQFEFDGPTLATKIRTTFRNRGTTDWQFTKRASDSPDSDWS